MATWTLFSSEDNAVVMQLYGILPIKGLGYAII